MITKYPEKATLKEVLSSSLTITSLKRICKRNGVFLLSPDKETVVRDAHLFYWGFGDINLISSQIEDEKNYKKSFRLQLDFEPSDDRSSAFSAICAAFSRYRTAVGSQSKVRFDSYNVVTVGGTQVLTGEVSYTRKKPGKVEMLSDITQHFSFQAKCPTNTRIDIDFLFADRNDIATAKKMVNEAISTSTELKPPVQISLKPLKIAERVELFDRFFGFTFENWRLKSLQDIKISDGQTEDMEETEQETITQSILTGIKSAHLSGTGLRSNPIVMQAVEKGYFFPKATIRFEHKRAALEIVVDVAFNTDELLLEINMISTYEVEDDKAFRFPMDVNEQKSALEEFHDSIQAIYSQIISERPQGDERVELEEEAPSAESIAVVAETK